MQIKFVYRSFAYAFDIDCDGDCTKTLHYIYDLSVARPEAKLLDFSPYQKMDEELFQMFVELALKNKEIPKRVSCIPLDREYVLKLFKEMRK